MFLSHIIVCLVLLIWSFVLGYMYPMPFCGYLYGYGVLCIVLPRLWFKFPIHKRIDPQFRIRLIAFIYYLLWSSGTVIQLYLMSKLFQNIPDDFQWAFPIVVASVKEANNFVVDHLISKSATSKNVVAKFVGRIRHLQFRVASWLNSPGLLVARMIGI